MTSLRRPLLSLLAVAFAMGGIFVVTTPTSAATTKKKPTFTYVTKCTKYYVKVHGVRTRKWNCRKVKVAVASAYKPRYNVMTSLGSKRKLPAKLVAVCGNGKNIYSPVSSSTCSGSAGIAWCANPKLSKYCPQY